jgi:protein-disulfide isomerase
MAGTARLPQSGVQSRSFPQEALEVSVFVSRRLVVSSLGAFAVASALAVVPASAQQKVDLKELLTPGTLPDKALGPENAPVTIVEYASMTCPHCADFHTQVFPKLKAEYIDKGKVRFVFREYPLDEAAMAASMLARCAGDDKFFTMVDVLFDQQRNWAIKDKVVPGLMRIAKQAGFTEQSFEACLKDNKLAQQIYEDAQRGSQKFGVRSTPTIFVNGEPFRGASFEELQKALDPLLKSAKTN